MTTELTVIPTVISGGQTGVDQAALLAAKAAGLRTGGYMPYGWLTLDGVREDFRETYGMTECQEAGYSPRTELNVIHSDATIRIAKTFSSPGERCTLSAIHRNKRPHLDIKWSGPKMASDQWFNHATVVEWLIENSVLTLNVAGNSEKTAPGINGAAYAYLVVLFDMWLRERTSHA